MHSFDLLFSLDSCSVKGLVLSLDSLDFPLHFLLPVLVLNLLSLSALVLEVPNFVKFGLFLDFKDSLFTGLGQEHVKNWLHFSVVVKEVVVLDLSDFVDTRFLGNVLRSFRFGLENIRLGFHISFFWLSLTLFSKEVGKVDFDSSWWAWSQVVRLGLVFRLLKFY